MAERRKLRTPPPKRFLAPGEKLQRDRLPGDDYETWGWVKEVKEPSDITREHLLTACNLGQRSSKSFCSSKYAIKSNGDRSSQRMPAGPAADGELLDDSIAVISDTDEVVCTKKGCSDNPNCLNYLGQQKWESEDKAWEAFMKMSKLGADPNEENREAALPIGLRNLGATCYANAFLQVWFQNLAFRTGVYQCQSSPEATAKFEDSPIFQLQVTFAALQQGNKSVFNPIKLVESLQLRTSEQQDAQEFSKLFMSHLDSEFKKQLNPELKSLLPSQFQGELVYATVCGQCKSRSEVKSSFLELEVPLENDSILEDRLATHLAPEQMTNDNKYLCPRCEDLQDATRFTELRSLPPVLHISLLRFVYDLSTMERKKSKHNVRFKPYMDMQPFLHGGRDCSSIEEKTKCMYELRGVLLHKGASAYHGHYEAQVYDVTAKTWYQFNDEEVAKIDSFHEPQIWATKSGSSSFFSRKGWKPKVRPKEREATLGGNSENDESDSKMIPVKRLRSKDAYMLIYARCEDPATSPLESSFTEAPPPKESSLPLVPVPPQPAQEVVKRLNEAHDYERTTFAEKKATVEEDFKRIRQMVQNIYRSWSLYSHNDESVILSRNALERWLCHWLEPSAKDSKKVKGKVSDGEEIKKDDAMDADEEFPNSLFDISRPKSASTSGADAPSESSGIIDNSQLSCKHGHLNPHKAKEIKRIRKSAYDLITNKSGCCFTHVFRTDDVCRECVEEEFIERRYQLEHPELVARFDQVCGTQSDSGGYWISRSWLKDWRLAKPKMHVPLRTDPPPDDPKYVAEVRCEHDRLPLNILSRRKISVSGYAMLKTLYPSWEPPAWNAEECAACDALLHISKQDKLVLRKQAEKEKLLLKRIHGGDFFAGHKDILRDAPCAMIESSFIRAWRLWLQRPCDATRPSVLDNSCLVCEHGLLNVDPNDSTDFNDDIVVVTMSEWKSFEQLYSATPCVTVSIVMDISNDAITKDVLSADIPTCSDCRRKRKLDFQSGSIDIVLLKNDDPVPDSSSQPAQNEDNNDAPSSSQPSQPTGTRQSKRIRDSKNKRRKINIKKGQTLLDIKIQIQKEYKVPTISQRLFHRGNELGDNSATVAQLQILSHDVIYFKEADEDQTLLMNSDTEGGPVNKKRKEGGAFHGTVLGSSPGPREVSSSVSEPGENGEHVIAMQADNDPAPGVECTVCTYLNELSNVACMMCGTIFS